MTNFTLHINLTAKTSNQPLTDREPKPRTLALLLRREEGLEDSIKYIVGNTAPGVLQGDTQTVPVLIVSLITLRHSDRQRSPVGHRINGIEQEIEEHLLEFMGIGKYGRM